MEVLWLLLGAGIAWFVLHFRATKARVRKAADIEFAQFIMAMDAWNADRQNFELLTRALHNFEVYDTRRADAVASPSGLAIPADRALLAGFWLQNLESACLIDPQGNQCRWNESAASFWDTIALLRSERDNLLLQDISTANGFE